MIVQQRTQERFYLDHLKGLKAHLFYGEDPFFVDFQIERFCTKYLKKNTTSLEIIYEEDLIKGITSIEEKLSSQGLFQKEPPFLFIKNATPKLIPLLENVFKKNISFDHPLILSASYLQKSSKLRLFFESNQNIAVLPCYPFQEGEWQNLIVETLKEFKKTISKQALYQLGRFFIEMPFSFHQELQKIVLYVGTAETITEEHVGAIVTKTTESAYETALELFLEKKKAPFSTINFPVMFEDFPAIGFLRLVIKNLLRLLTVKINMAEGAAFNEAAQSLSPMIPPFLVPTFRGHLSKWSEDELKRALRILEKTELAAKQNYELSDTHIINGLLLCF